MSGANFENSVLQGADLRYAILSSTKFIRADLKWANLTRSVLDNTHFIETDFNKTVGLKFCVHNGPSVLDLGTISLSNGLPSEFLKGCGYSEMQLKINEYHSCFISYSNDDINYVERLYSDLTYKGVQCWFAPEDMKIGNNIRDSLDRAIHLHEKLLLVLSSSSVNSSWVEQEVETALERERKEKELIVFPVRIDDAVMNTNAGWAAYLRKTRHIGDFTRWKLYDAYQAGLERLLRDLRKDVVEIFQKKMFGSEL